MIDDAAIMTYLKTDTLLSISFFIDVFYTKYPVAHSKSLSKKVAQSYFLVYDCTLSSYEISHISLRG